MHHLITAHLLMSRADFPSRLIKHRGHFAWTAIHSLNLTSYNLSFLVLPVTNTIASE
jgi:hypothetical protein